MSSMLGLFQELGPCAVDPKGDLVYNEYAWNNVSNMLFSECLAGGTWFATRGLIPSDKPHVYTVPRLSKALAGPSTNLL